MIVMSFSGSIEGKIRRRGGGGQEANHLRFRLNLGHSAGPSESSSGGGGGGKKWGTLSRTKMASMGC